MKITDFFLNSGRILPLLEEQEIPLLRRLPQQAQPDHRRQRGSPHRQEERVKGQLIQIAHSAVHSVAIM